MPALLLVLAGCGAVGDSGPEQVVRDSSGVTIVEVPEAAWASVDEWLLEPDPSVEIGVVDGPEEYRLFRVTDAVRLSDGTIVVANAGSSELRFYDAEGRHIRSVGGSGEGPGEYGVIGFVDRIGSDSLIVWDGNLRRGTILGRDGGFGRTFPGPDFEEFYSMLGTVGRGMLLGHRSGGIDIQGMPTQVLRNSATFFRFSPAGETHATIGIGEYFINEAFVSDGRMIGMPFGYRGVQVGDGERFHHGAADAYQIRSFDLDGGLVRIVRSPRPNRPLPRSEIDALLERVPASSRAFYAEVPYHETLPAYGEMEVDAEGNLWVGDYLASDAETREWSIHDPTGRLIGTLGTPPRFTMFDIGGDYVLGSVRDELDVERVVLYRFSGPGEA